MKLTYAFHRNIDFWCERTFGGCFTLRVLWLGVVIGTVAQRAQFNVEIGRWFRRHYFRDRMVCRVFGNYRVRRRRKDVKRPSGVGFWYGHAGSNHSVLEDLLKCCDDYDFDDLDADDIAAALRCSVIARMSMTMEHARPYDVRLRMALADKECWNCRAALAALANYCDVCGAEVGHAVSV